ncbi:MAG: (2Fe-2S)-binding protein [Candidatus Rokubacteria bacterium]|nr:(2Fe-2S)-binding protein [Candidatus Rokubacteria bacterium]
MRRRAFLGCGALAGVSLLRAAWPAAAARAAEAQARWGRRVRLVGENGAPLRAGQLVPHRDYVFLYPYAGTPCFLLDLGKPVPPAEVPLRLGGGYAWPGGVGRLSSIVAYAAICPHTYTHPTRDHAMIHYFAPDQPATLAGRGGVITCCVHGSAFDPVRGAVPVQPPAELPLAAVLLEWDEATDGLHATGVVGEPVFEEFFKSFPWSARREVEGVATVQELSRYSGAVLPC